jgi:bifunctional DNA-binding transcriptional regulator/antitoxin component of YhaV-PrlF toxin-antitoxin module
MATTILGEKTAVVKASSKFDSLRTTIPKSIVNHWGLKEGDILEWNWEVQGGEMVLKVTRSKQKFKK